MSDSEYFTQRSRQERSAAHASSDPDIAAVHAKMADLYDAAARDVATAPEAPVRLLRQAR